MGAFVIVLFLSSCTKTINTLSDPKTINNLSVLTYSSGSFSPELLARDGLAILPVRQNVATPEEKKYIDTLLTEAVGKRFPKMKTISSDGIAKMLKGSKDDKIWLDRLVEGSSPRVVGRVEGIERISKRLGVRYLLQTDIRIAEVAGGAQHIRIFGRIWDGLDKEIVWSGYGEARGYVYLFFPAVPAPFEKDAKVAVKGLVANIPKVN